MGWWLKSGREYNILRKFSQRGRSNKMIDKSFIANASNLLADTDNGLTGSEIFRYCNDFAVRYQKTIPYTEAKDKNPKKSEVLRKNLEKFEANEQFHIIQTLCDLDKFQGNNDITELKMLLTKQYGQYAPTQLSEIFIHSVNLVRHWLDGYPNAKKEYESALEKKNIGIYSRNCVDDLRSAFEQFLKQLFQNEKSLENQKTLLLKHLGEKEINKEINNLFKDVFDFFVEYQNHNAKHNNNVKDIEVDLIFNQTTILMQFLIQLEKSNNY